MQDKEVTDLIRRMKELMFTDIVGITASDVRVMLTEWLADNGHQKQADRFESQLIKFVDNPRLVKAQTEYDESA